MKRTLLFSLLLFFVLSSLSLGLTASAQNEAKKVAKLQRQSLNLEKKIADNKLKLEMQNRASLESAASAQSKLATPSSQEAKKTLLAPKPKPMPKINYPPLELGISLGLIANIPGGYAELRWNRPLDLDPVGIKTGVAYADGKDANGVERRHALIFADGVWHLNPPGTDGVGTYIGGGLNYLVLTSGHISGAVAGEAYFGLESRMGKTEFLYAEFGFGAIRTGVSPSYKGLNATVGYQSKI